MIDFIDFQFDYTSFLIRDLFFVFCYHINNLIKFFFGLQ